MAAERRNLVFDAIGGPRLTIRRGQQTAADLDARGFRFGGADQSGGDVAIDLGELVLVDGSLAAFALRPATAAQRPEHGEDRRDRHQREHKPQRHQASSGGTAPRDKAPMRRFTPRAASRAIDNYQYAGSDRKVPKTQRKAEC